MSDNHMENSQAGNSTNTVWQIVGRLVTIATIVLTVIDFLIAKFTGIKASPFGKGFVGFILSAVILYVTQYFVAGYVISWMAAIIGALIYGIVDYFLPGDEQM